MSYSRPSLMNSTGNAGPQGSGAIYRCGAAQVPTDYRSSAGTLPPLGGGRQRLSALLDADCSGADEDNHSVQWERLMSPLLYH